MTDEASTGSEQRWHLDAEGKRLWDADDPSDCWNIADLEIDRIALTGYLNALERKLRNAGELLEWAEMELRSLPSSGHEAIDRLTEQNIHRFLLDHAELTQTLFYSEARAALRSEGGD